MFLRLFGAYSVLQGSLSGAGPDGRGFHPGPRPLARGLTLAAGPTAWSFSLAAGPTAWCRNQRGLNIFDAVMAEHRDAFEIVQNCRPSVKKGGVLSRGRKNRWMSTKVEHGESSPGLRATINTGLQCIQQRTADWYFSFDGIELGLSLKFKSSLADADDAIFGDPGNRVQKLFLI
ncbi:hypothetical protein DFH09DRAFT_1093781 [Mycena vulgaris]|nr:hypothetical protein DFH09DRAFT_1093781 [Mycena vulgaris]